MDLVISNAERRALAGESLVMPRVGDSAALPGMESWSWNIRNGGADTVVREICAVAKIFDTYFANNTRRSSNGSISVAPSSTMTICERNRS